MPVAHSYIRFSSIQQKEGASLERQRGMVAEWLERNPGYKQSQATYEDLGISGWSGAHLDNAFGRLLAAVENGTIKPGDCILIEAIDRAGRIEPMQMLHILTSITAKGVKLVSLDDGLTYDNTPGNANNLFLLVAKVQQAWAYSDALSRRLKDAYKRKREAAAAGAAIGETKVTKRRTPVWLTTDGQLVEHVAPFVVQAFEDYAAGLGERRIHRRIYEHPECPPELANLSPGTVKKWMRNKTAIGYWGETPNVYPAVVTPELFYRVQQKLADVYKPRASGATHMLVGLVKCSRCGSNLVLRKNMKSPPAFLCVRYIRLGKKGCSNNSSIPFDVVSYVFNQTNASATKRAELEHRTTSEGKRDIVITGQLDELTAKRGRLSRALAALDSDNDAPELAEALAEVARKIKTLRTEQESLQVDPYHVSDEEAREYLESLHETDPARLSAMLQSVGYAMQCDGTSITVLEDSKRHLWPEQRIEYLGVDRKKWVYLLNWQGEPGSPVERIELPTPHGQKLASE